MKPQSQIYSRYFTYIWPVTKIPIIRTYGSAIFTLLVMIVFIFFAIKPTVETISNLQKNLSDSKLVLEKIKKKSSDLSKAKQNFDSLDPDIKLRVSSAIPETASLKSIIQTLEKSARNHEASVSALQIQPLVLEPEVKNRIGKIEEINFTFNVEGQYQNLILLLQDLKSSDRLISIDNLSLSKVSDGSGLIMSLTGKGYYVK